MPYSLPVFIAFTTPLHFLSAPRQSPSRCVTRSAAGYPLPPPPPVGRHRVDERVKSVHGNPHLLLLTHIRPTCFILPFTGTYSRGSAYIHAFFSASECPHHAITVPSVSQLPSVSGAITSTRNTSLGVIYPTSKVESPLPRKTTNGIT